MAALMARINEAVTAHSWRVISMETLWCAHPDDLAAPERVRARDGDETVVQVVRVWYHSDGSESVALDPRYHRYYDTRHAEAEDSRTDL